MGQREIKFRAWDRVEKHFVYFELFKGLNNYTLPIYKYAKLSEWKQYTGLKDRNGKKIYDGDILKWKWRRIAAVEFKKGAFVTCEDQDYGNFNVSDGDEEDREVIGNIYEHPEMPVGCKIDVDRYGTTGFEIDKKYGIEKKRK